MKVVEPLRSSGSGLLAVHRVKTKYGEAALSHSAAQIWNKNTRRSRNNTEEAPLHTPFNSWSMINFLSACLCIYSVHADTFLLFYFFVFFLLFHGFTLFSVLVFTSVKHLVLPCGGHGPHKYIRFAFAGREKPRISSLCEIPFQSSVL